MPTSYNTADQSPDSEPPHSGVDTSLAAAEAIAPCAQQLRERVYAYVAGRFLHGATCEEVCTALELDGNTVRPRLWELEGRRGLPPRIEKTSRTRLTGAGRSARVYVAIAGDAVAAA